MKRDRRSVYSSEGGRLCPECGEPETACRCPRPDPVRGDGVVRVGRQTKGRKGTGVTVVGGLPLDAGGLKTLAGELKRLCGSGGTVKDGVVEIQGDHRDRIVGELQARGWTVKRSGG